MNHGPLGEEGIPLKYEDVEDWIKALHPEDYYFQMDRAGDSGCPEDSLLVSEGWFLITPKTYYDAMGCLLDTAVGNNRFPSGFDEMCDSTFEYNGDLQTGRQKLLDAGFVEKKMV